MIQDIRKEIRFGFRSYRFLILLVAFLFFALMDPIMTKFIVPEIMKSQMGLTPEMMAQLVDTSQAGVMRAYMGDVFELISIVVVFSLCGLMAQEIKENTLVLPLCAGKRFGSIAGAKLIVFGAALLLAPVLAVLANYVYTGVLFAFEVPFGPALLAGLLIGMYMVFLLALIVMWGAVFKKPLAAGFASFASTLALHFIGSAFGIQTYIPSGLFAEAQQLGAPSEMLAQTLLITALDIVALVFMTLLRLKRMEWNERN